MLGLQFRINNQLKKMYVEESEPKQKSKKKFSSPSKKKTYLHLGRKLEMQIMCVRYYLHYKLQERGMQGKPQCAV